MQSFTHHHSGEIVLKKLSLSTILVLKIAESTYFQKTVLKGCLTGSNFRFFGTSNDFKYHKTKKLLFSVPVQYNNRPCQQYCGTK